LQLQVKFWENNILYMACKPPWKQATPPSVGDAPIIL
jgi:hypothetical protein